MRLHLLEFEDYEWFPHVVREGITDFLRFVTELTFVYKPAGKLIAEMVNKINMDTIIDLCAGGGGGVEKVSREINKLAGRDIKILLTDKYPNIPALKYVKENSRQNISYLEESVDALNVPEKLKGARTMFSSFHHFKPEDARKILEDSSKKKMPILIFEAGERSLTAVIGVIIITILVCAFATPFMKPFKWSRLFYTYIIPLILLSLLWDGVVSMLRIYKPKEMLKLAEGINSNNFVWRAGKINYKGLRITYMTGEPESIKN